MCVARFLKRKQWKGELMETLNYKNLKYVMRKPVGFQEAMKYPLVVFFHGAGGRTADISYLENHEFFKLSEPFCKNTVTIAPKCDANSWFNVFEQLQEFIKFLATLPYVDKERVYLIGNSMGGYATWQLAMAMPKWFAAIVPICGGGMYWNSGELINMGVWAFHGSDDKTVFCEESVKMVEGINQRGGNAKLTIYRGVGHNSWSQTFCSEELWIWLFQQTNRYKKIQDKYGDAVAFG